MKKRFLVVALALFMVLGFAGMASAAIVWYDLSSTAGGGDGIPDTEWTMKPGDIVWVDVNISGVPEPGLVSSGLLANFDPNQLEVTPGTIFFDPPWTKVFDLSKISYDNDAGIIDFVGGTFASPYGDVPLIRIELHCKAPGTSTVDFGLHGGTFDDFVLTDSEATVIYPEFSGLTITNVPIPSALLLFGSGLVGFIGLGRRKIRG